MNLADIQAFATRAAATGAELWPATVLLAGLTYAATIPEPRVLGSLVAGGEISEGILLVRIATALLPLKPAANQSLQWKRPTEEAYRPQPWWIDDVKLSPLDVEWLITCSPKN